MLTASFQEDLRWWLSFERRFNGTTSMLGKFAALQLSYSDASNWGFGSLYGYDWVVRSFHKGDEAVLDRMMDHQSMVCDKKIVKRTY